MVGCQDLNFMIREPDAMCEQHTRRIEQAEGFECFHGPPVVAPLGFLHIEFALIAMCMKADLVMLADVNRAFICLGRGVEHVLKTNPHVHSTIRSAMPLLDQVFICGEFFEIIMVGVFSHIRDEHSTYTKLRSCLRTAMHVPPHVHDCGRSR